MKRLLIGAVACIGLAGCASQSGEGSSCSPPSRATYTVSASPLVEGCGRPVLGTWTYENGLFVTISDADPELLDNGCFSRAATGRTWSAVTFDEGWTRGTGEYGYIGCRYSITLARSGETK